MSNLETRIAEWRARMLRALPHRYETVAELEEHLREHCADLQRQGKSDGEAFALAQERIGEPQAIAREFNRMPACWRPGLILLPVLALTLAFFLGYYFWFTSQRLPITALMVASLVTSTTGFFGLVGSALIATTACLKSARRPLSERERLAVRRMLAKLARLSVVFIAIGWAAGTAWRSQLIWNSAWMLWSYHLRLAGLLASLAMLIFVHARPATSDRVRWLTAMLPFLVVLFSSFGPFLRVANIPVGWVCVAILLVGQVYFALPRFRIRIERLPDRV
jgi:hypothetical protein